MTRQVKYENMKEELTKKSNSVEKKLHRWSCKISTRKHNDKFNRKLQ